jgi:predicted RNase H-like nuclease (RuvC/YqgF family)
MRERYELIDTIHALEAELSAIDAALGFDAGSTRSAGDRVARIEALRARVREAKQVMDALDWLDD